LRGKKADSVWSEWSIAPKLVRVILARLYTKKVLSREDCWNNQKEKTPEASRQKQSSRRLEGKTDRGDG